MCPSSLLQKLAKRKQENAFRTLQIDQGIDFCSNDYLGMVHQQFMKAYFSQNYPSKVLADFHHGSTGSRLLAGNSKLAEEIETELALFHQAEAALLFNSGYDANVGILSSVPGKDDLILFDALAHASIRDGIRLSLAKAHSFRHNDLRDLEKKLQQPCIGNRFIVTETVFSMDGDVPDFQELCRLAEEYNAFLILDEAHGIGIAGEKGEGLIQAAQLHHKCFARIYTFGKAMGCHGAVVVGDQALKDFLINYCRSFIYTTALPEPSLLAVKAAYALVPTMAEARQHLYELIDYWHRQETPFQKLQSKTPVQGIVVPGVNEVKKVEHQLLKNGLQARAILSPTVPAGEERIRLVFHAYNTMEEIDQLVQTLKN